MDDAFNPWAKKLRYCSNLIQDMKEAVKDGSIDLGENNQAFAAWVLACRCQDYLNFYRDRRRKLLNEEEESVK